jgi:hypothetical protein
MSGWPFRDVNSRRLFQRPVSDCVAELCTLLRFVFIVVGHPMLGAVTLSVTSNDPMIDNLRGALYADWSSWLGGMSSFRAASDLHPKDVNQSAALTRFLSRSLH